VKLKITVNTGTKHRAVDHEKEITLLLRERKKTNK